MKNTRLNLIKSGNNMFFQYFVLAVITVMAGALRFYKLGEWSFWIDEVYTVNRAKNAFDTFDWLPITEILVGLTFIFEDVGEWNARFFPALIGTITIPIIYFPLRNLFGPLTALLVSLLLAVSSWHLFWSQNSRFYTVLILLYTLAMVLFFLGIQRDRPWYVFIAMIILTFAIRERLTSLFFFPVVVSYLLAVRFLPIEKPMGVRFKNLVFLLLPVAIMGAYELNKFYASIGMPDSMDHISAGHHHSGIYVILTKFWGVAGVNPLWLLTSIIYNTGIPLVCLALVGGIYLSIKRRGPEIFFLLGALIPLGFILVLSIFVYSLDRYIFISLSSWIILAALVIREAVDQRDEFGKILGLGLLVLLVTSALFQNLLYFKYQHGNRSNWKEAFAYVSERKTDGDIVVAVQPELGQYYLNEKVVVMSEIEPDLIAQSAKRFWFIDIGWIDPSLNKWIQENSILVNVQDVHTSLENLQMRIYLYDPAINSEAIETKVY